MHYYSIFVETNAVNGIYNFILSTTAEEISDVLLIQVADPSVATLFDSPIFASDVEQTS